MPQINPDVIKRYQFGGDIFDRLVEQYGYGVATDIADAAATGDGETLNLAIQSHRYGQVQEGFWEGTAGNFIEILATDPLTAPLQMLNRGVAQIFNSSGVKTISTIAVVVAVAALVIYANKKP